MVKYKQNDMFLSTIDAYDTLPAWWETDCVKYGLSYTPVRTQLTALMGSHVVRLTDRKYMTQFASKLQKDHEVRQMIRIEQRKSKPPLILPDLRPSESLLRSRSRRQHRQCAQKFQAEAAKMCKQLPQILADFPPSQ